MRIPQLTFTRFIAAISIVIFHYGKGSMLFNNNYVSFIFQQANIGVSYFFILSGFVMIIAYGNKDKVNFNDFLKNRLARIYPAYLLALFLFLSSNLFKDINIPDLLLNIFMLQAWIPEKALTMNTPGWSLSVELFFYLCFPFLLNRIYSKNQLKSNDIWILLFWLSSQVIFFCVVFGILKIANFSTRDICYHPVMHLNEFLIGNLAGLFYLKKLKNQQKNYFSAILLTLIILVMALKFKSGLAFHNGMLALLFVPLILLISLSNDRLTKLFSKSPFVFLGEISFGVYILQFPVWILFSDYRMEKYFGLKKDSDFTASFFIRLAILIGVATLSYLYFEQPVRNKIKKIQG